MGSAHTAMAVPHTVRHCARHAFYTKPPSVLPRNPVKTPSSSVPTTTHGPPEAIPASSRHLLADFTGFFGSPTLSVRDTVLGMALVYRSWRVCVLRPLLARSSSNDGLRAQKAHRRPPFRSHNAARVDGGGAYARFGHETALRWSAKMVRHGRCPI
jgi:hypothetical protein